MTAAVDQFETTVATTCDVVASTLFGSWTTTVPATTTTLPAYGTPYSSGTQIVPTASSYYDGVYIPPGRVPGEAVQTCGD